MKDQSLVRTDKQMRAEGWKKNKEGNWQKAVSIKGSFALDAVMDKYHELLDKGYDRDEAWTKAKTYSKRKTTKKFPKRSKK